MIFGKSKCTELCEGVITDIKTVSGDGVGSSSTYMYVDYIVDGVQYRLKEMVRVKSRTTKLGPIPVGREHTSVLDCILPGTKVTVQYNPEKPKRAYLPENEGWRTG